MRITTIVRGTTSIPIVVGCSGWWFANGQPMPLEAAARFMNGSVLVPLRSAAKVMGARVDWDERTRAAYITSAQFPPPPLSDLAGSPPPPWLWFPTSPAAVVEGTVVGFDMAGPFPNLRVVQKNGNIEWLPLTEDVAIILVDIGTGCVTHHLLTAAGPGSFVRVAMNKDGRGPYVRSSFRRVEGHVRAVTPPTRMESVDASASPEGRSTGPRRVALPLSNI